MSVENIPITLEKLLIKLDMISRIKPGEKFNISSMSFVNSNSWVGTIRRMLAGENRSTLMVYLNATIYETIQAVRDFRNNDSFSSLIREAMIKCKTGIVNLSETYKDDPYLLSQLGICITTLDLQIN
jgi:hypothetical protein